MAKGEIIVFGIYPNGQEKLASIVDYVPLSNGGPFYTQLRDFKTKELIDGNYYDCDLPIEVDYEEV